MVKGLRIDQDFKRMRLKSKSSYNVRKWINSKEINHWDEYSIVGSIKEAGWVYSILE